MTQWILDYWIGLALLMLSFAVVMYTMRSHGSRPRCDDQECDDPSHARVHTANSGRRYVPIDSVIKEEMERIRAKEACTDKAYRKR